MKIFYKNNIGSIVHIENIEEGPEQGISITVGKGEDEDNFDGSILFFDTKDDFRKWVNKIYKKFGGVSDYIILLAHRNYHKATKQLEFLIIGSKVPLTDLFKIHIEKPYQHLIDTYNMKEEEVWERIESLVDKGYLEYGVNIRYAWLTEKGEKYFKELKDGRSGIDGEKN